MPGSVHRKVGIVAVNLHTQCAGRVCHTDTDCTKADNTQRLAHYLGAGKGALALFDHFGNLGAVALKGLFPLDGGNDPAGAYEHTGYNQFLNGVGVGTGGVENHDSCFTAAIERNIVDACACAADGHKAAAEFHFVHFGRTHHYGVGIFDVVTVCIFCFIETVKSRRRDFI